MSNIKSSYNELKTIKPSRDLSSKINKYCIYFCEDSGCDRIIEYSAKNRTARNALDIALRRFPKRKGSINYKYAFVTGLLTHAETKPLLKQSLKLKYYIARCHQNINGEYLNLAAFEKSVKFIKAESEEEAFVQLSEYQQVDSAIPIEERWAVLPVTEAKFNQLKSDWEAHGKYIQS